MRTATVQSTSCALILLAATTAGCSGSHATPDKGSTKSGQGTSFPGPPFPGGGVSGASQSLAAGVETVTCGPNPPPAGSFGPTPGAKSHIACLYDSEESLRATIEWIVESTEEDDAVHVRLTMNPDFVDNTYGENAIGWEKDGQEPAAPPPMDPMGKAPKMPKPGHSGHTFKDLVGSDHAEFRLSDAAGELVLHFKADYVSEDADALSGYATLGVTGGEGKMILGDAGDIIAVSTSIDRDLNACGYSEYTTDSPATDANYSVNADAPKWDYRVVYDVYVKQSAFGASGFGDAIVNFVHASPSKLADNTVNVTPKDCPPGYCNDPDGCGECVGEGCTPPDEENSCGSDAPDVDCADGSDIPDAGEWPLEGPD